jgi:hypothetical protein
MVLEYILFVVYLLLFCWLITKVSFVKKAGLSSKLVILLFLVKILGGLAIGWISYHLYDVKNDYWDMNRQGWDEYQLLWNNPKEYLTNIFKSGYQNGYGGLFDSFQSFWNDLRNNIIIKLISVCDLFSRGNYYINSLFFNFCCFLGHIAFYRIFIQIYKKQQLGVIICCFFLPSLLYFSSGIQKDGIVFSVLGALCFAVYTSLQSNTISFKRLFVIILSLPMLFLIRSYVLINIVPALIIWVLVEKYKWKPLRSFIIGYIVAGLIFFNISSLFHSIDPPKTVVQKQADFLALPVAVTQINVDTLQPNFKSFLQNTPQALNHLLLRPYPLELPSKSMLPMNIELLIYQLLFVLFLFFRQKDDKGGINSFILFGVFFTLTMFLFIGYLMPNLGSLIRYRSIYIPFLITPVICGINWKNVVPGIFIKK